MRARTHHRPHPTVDNPRQLGITAQLCTVTSWRFPALTPESRAGARGTDAVRRALANARQMRRRSTTGSRDLAGRRARRRANLRGRSPGYSGPAPDTIDPQRLDSVLAEYVEDRGWELPLAQARVFAEWPSLVGREVAAHCEPVTLRGGELRVSAESTAWATQLRLLSATMLARLVAELGPQVVTRLVITGADRAELATRQVLRPGRARPPGHLWLTGRAPARGRPSESAERQHAVAESGPVWDPARTAGVARLRRVGVCTTPGLGVVVG